MHGIFILGSTGEGDSLSAATQYRFAELVAEVVAGRVPLFLGAMQPSTELGIEFVRACPVLEAFAAIVVGVPYYRGLRCEAEVLEHYRRVHGATDRPVIVYKTPHPASRVLSVDTLLRLALEDGIIAYKDSSGRLDHIEELVSHGMNRGGFRMFQGEPALSRASLVIGADGLIPGTANFIPHVFVALYDAVWAGNDALASAAQREILRFRQFARMPTPFSSRGFHFSTFKAGLDAIGFGGGRPAPPYQPLPAELLERIREHFRRHQVLEGGRAVERAVAEQAASRARPAPASPDTIGLESPR